jgi:hypothetical protein
MAVLRNDDGRRWWDAATCVQQEDALAFLDPEGVTPYHYLTRARGFAKTGDGAAFVLALLLAQLPSSSRCYWLAADKEQGGLAIDSIRGFVARTPELAGALDIDSFRVTVRRSGSSLEVLAADAPSAFGRRPALVVVDELAMWLDTESSRRVFDAMTSALAKVEGARCLVITSAGDPSHFAYRVLEHARRDPLWRVHEVSGPPPWVDRERLAEQRRRLLPSMYERLFANRWVESEDRLTTIADVRGCVGHAGDLGYESGRRYVASLDIGLVRDRTACVVAHGEDRPGGLVVVVDRVQVWEGSRRRPVDLGEVEAWVEEVCREYRAPLVFDPFQAAHLTQRLKARGVRVEPFTFSQQHIGRLAVTLFRLLRDRLLDLPDDDALVDEIAAVRLRETAPGAYRIDHDSNRHDDRVIALAMAAEHLVQKTRRSSTSGGPVRPRGPVGVLPPSALPFLRGTVSRD